MISVRVTGPVFRIPRADEAMILVTCARQEIFVMIPVNAIPGRADVHRMGGEVRQNLLA